MQKMQILGSQTGLRYDKALQKARLLTLKLLRLDTQTGILVEHLYHKQQHEIGFRENLQSKHRQRQIYQCRLENMLLFHSLSF